MTTEAEVSAGSCGFVTGIRVERRENCVEVRITTACEKVAKFAEAVGRLQLRDALSEMCASPVYRAATQARLHPGCPVPAAVLRAVEIETGAATPRSVVIDFKKR